MRIQDILLSIAVALTLVVGTTGCLLTTEGRRGVEFVEELTEERFTILESDVRLSVGYAVMAMEADTDQAEQLTMLANVLGDLAEGGVTTAIVDYVLERFPNIDPPLVNLIRLAENRIREFGGLPYIEDEEGVRLTERSRRLIAAISSGINDGLTTL